MSNSNNNNKSLKPKILFVDDEQNILDSLQRTLRKEGYEMFFANGGEQALSILYSQPIDLIVSDQRMPGMNGSELLEKIKEKHPDTVRMILTGYQDISAAVAAINQGGVYQFLQKPWDDEYLKLTLRKAIEMIELRNQNEFFKQQIAAQNEELKNLALALEKRAEEKSIEADQKGQKVDEVYDHLRKNFESLVQILVNLQVKRDPLVKDHIDRVKQMVEFFCDRLKVEGVERVWIITSALLHDVGRLVLPDHLLLQKKENLKPVDRKAYDAHVNLGAEMVESVEQLKPLGPMIKHHHESWDGKGIPHQLKQEEIPLGARMLCVASDYDHWRSELGWQEAERIIESKSGIAYDPKIVKTMKEYVLAHEVQEIVFKDVEVLPHQLKEGMVLSCDLKTSGGLRILGENHALTVDNIGKILNYHETQPFKSKIKVRVRK